MKLKLLLILLLLIPLVSSAPVEPAEPIECGITNLAECIPQKMYEYLLVIINAPLLPMLIAIQSLLTTDVSIELFHHLWAVIRYILSFFYIFFFLYSGYIFLLSNANPIKRAQAKDMLKNTFLMIILINGSYYIYDLVLALSSSVNMSLISMIDPHFFMLTADNLANIGLQLIFAFTYAMALFGTMLMLTFRYMVVSLGVVLFPLGLFCFFTPPLKSYGKLILNILGIFIFVTTLHLLIILTGSILLDVAVFENFKILVMIVCFSFINYSLWLAIKFAIKSSTNHSVKEDLGQALKYAALLV